jgi:hypothetical protein
MDNPQTTEVAIANTFEIANMKNDNVRSNRFKGQDLYKIYTNYSYTCSVDMMGCAQILPLMHFQLNNIPMFRGAYQIINVEHNITPGDMTTSFKGVRINKTKIPMIKSCISTTNMKEVLNNYNEYSKNFNMKPLNIKELKQNESNAKLMEVDMSVFADTIMNEYPDNIIFSSGQIDQFNKLNPKLRQLMYCIVGDLNKLSDKLGYKLGVIVTSSTREETVNSNSGSDHLVNNGGASERRKRLIGTNQNGEEVEFSKMGCAIDMQGLKNGVVNKGEASINVFSLIANNYYDYIRQLIWEVNGHAVCQNDISLIHLASYGKVGQYSDKNEIFVANAPKYSGTETGSLNLPSEYLKILLNLSKNNQLKKSDGSIITLNNFGKYPTKEELAKLYNNAISIV